MDNFDFTSLHKEIDLVENCITRMAKNSFALKGWLVSLLAVIIALIPDKSKINSIFMCCLILGITICFWYLDGFYLKQERLYRKKYEWIISERIKNNHNFLYDLNPYNKKMWIRPNSKVTILNSMFSKTLIPFYGLIILFSLLSMYFK